MSVRPSVSLFCTSHRYLPLSRLLPCRDGVIAVSKEGSQLTVEYLPDQRSHLYGITIATSQCLSGEICVLLSNFHPFSLTGCI